MKDEVWVEVYVMQLDWWQRVVFVVVCFAILALALSAALYLNGRESKPVPVRSDAAAA